MWARPRLAATLLVWDTLVLLPLPPAASVKAEIQPRRNSGVFAGVGGERAVDAAAHELEWWRGGPQRPSVGADVGPPTLTGGQACHSQREWQNGIEFIFAHAQPHSWELPMCRHNTCSGRLIVALPQEPQTGKDPSAPLQENGCSTPYCAGLPSSGRKEEPPRPQHHQSQRHLLSEKAWH